MDTWRDCGWSLPCQREGADFDVFFSEVEKEDWLLIVSPLKKPGLLGKLLGRKPAATPIDVFHLGVCVHRLLASRYHLGTPRWRWDDYPEEDSSPEPEAPEEYA